MANIESNFGSYLAVAVRRSLAQDAEFIAASRNGFIREGHVENGHSPLEQPVHFYRYSPRLGTDVPYTFFRPIVYQTNTREDVS